MQCLIGCLLALVVVSAAFAGEDPYIGIVGNDCVKGTETNIRGVPCVANKFYFSPKHQQFLYDQEDEDWDVPVCDPYSTFPPKTVKTRWGDTGCEMFLSSNGQDYREICDTLGGRGERNYSVGKDNFGWFEWYIRLPKKPSGEINICIQCGVLKIPDSGFDTVMRCAAETGERIGTGECTRDQVDPGVNPIVETALPKITAIAYPGPYSPYVDPDYPNDPTKSPFQSFHLTAYKNPGKYELTVDGNNKMLNNGSLQVLDGSDRAKVLLKSCMDKCVIAKIPVTNQKNFLGETEYDLEAGDLIYIRMEVPIQNTVYIYCHSQSASLRGIGESP